MEVVVSTVHITNLVDVGFDGVLKLESNHASQGRQVTVGIISYYIKVLNAFYDTDEKAFKFQLQPVYVPRRKRSHKFSSSSGSEANA